LSRRPGGAIPQGALRPFRPRYAAIASDTTTSSSTGANCTLEAWLLSRPAPSARLASTPHEKSARNRALGPAGRRNPGKRGVRQREGTDS
jgi:hypothetical protein